MTETLVMNATFAAYPAPQRDNTPQGLELALAFQGVMTFRS
jgi:hypothetical protein